MKNVLKITLPIVLLMVIGFAFKPTKKQPNILFIAVDDLRPELGCYGNDYIKSPNIDKLASEGYLFENHYVTVPTCGASRHSLLTGNCPKQPNI